MAKKTIVFQKDKSSHMHFPDKNGKEEKDEHDKVVPGYELNICIQLHFRFYC